MAIFFTFSPTSNHIHPLQVENCDSNSRLVVDEYDNGKFRLERVKLALSASFEYLCMILMGLRPLEIFYSFSAGIDFRRQNYRRQVMTIPALKGLNEL